MGDEFGLLNLEEEHGSSGGIGQPKSLTLRGRSGGRGRRKGAEYLKKQKSGSPSLID